MPSEFVADLVGHEKASFTFGVYSAGALFEKKREAYPAFELSFEGRVSVRQREAIPRSDLCPAPPGR